MIVEVNTMKLLILGKQHIKGLGSSDGVLTLEIEENTRITPEGDTRVTPEADTRVAPQLV